MEKFELDRMNRMSLIEEVISSYENGEDMKTSLLEIMERERNFKPSLSARVAAWKERMNNLPVDMAEVLIESGYMTEETTPIPGDAVGYDRGTGFVIGYVNNSLQIEDENGEIFYLPYQLVYMGDDDYNKLPDGARNFWMFTNASDIKWAKTHIVTLSACGFKVFNAASSENDRIGICTGDSDENAMWERLYKNRFNTLD